MQIEHDVLELRTRHAFHIARARGERVRRNVWVRVRFGEGDEGWGEAPVSTAYYGETADTVVAVLPRLAAAAEDAARGDPLALERVEAAVDAAIGYNTGAKAAVSAALHDLAGKRLGVPVWKLWGLDPDAAPRSSFTIGLAEPETMREHVREAADYPILKIKIGTDRDAEILRLVREEAPHAAIRVDANTGWTVKQALANLPMLYEYEVELLEQPLAPRDIDGFRTLRRASRIPIVADESCKNSADVRQLAGAVDAINIKLAKCGSLREAVRMVHVARSFDMEVMLGCMVESSLGIAASVQLAPLVDYLDLDGAALLAEDPFSGPGITTDGSVEFNREPGLGVQRAGGSRGT